MQTNAKLIKCSPRYYPSAIKHVRALADEARLDEAEEVLISALNDPTPPPALERCYTDLLGRMWRATKDLTGTKALFGRLETHFTHLPPSVTVFNQMIQSCLEAKDHVAAKYYLQLMTEKYHLEPNVKTLGRLLLRHAQKRDWPTVEEGFREMKERFGHQETYGKDFAAIFNPILVEHVHHEDGRIIDTMQFISRAIDRYGLVPDRYTSNFMVTACLKNGYIVPLLQWLVVAERFGLRLDADTVRCLLKRTWKHPTRSWELLEQLHHIDTELIDQDCKKLVQDLVTSKTWGQQLKGDLSPINGLPSKATPGEKLLAEMRRLKGLYRNPAAAVRLYQTAHEKGIKTSQRVLAEAVSAFSISRGDYDMAAAESFLKSTSYSSQELHVALIPLLMHRLQECIRWQGFDEMRRVVLGFYHLLQAKRVPIVHHLTTKAAQLLVSIKRPEYALSLLREVHELGWARRTPVDIALMTVYLQVYMAMHSIKGIQWTVLHVIRLQLEIDGIFSRTLKAACRRLIKWTKTETNVEEQAENIRILRECFLRVETRKRTQRCAMDLRTADILELFLHGSQGNLISFNSICPRPHMSGAAYPLFSSVWRPILDHDGSGGHEQQRSKKKKLQPSDYLELGNLVQQQGSLKAYLKLPEGKSDRVVSESSSLAVMGSHVQTQDQRGSYDSDRGYLRSSAAGG